MEKLTKEDVPQSAKTLCIGLGGVGFAVLREIERQTTLQIADDPREDLNLLYLDTSELDIAPVKEKTAIDFLRLTRKNFSVIEDNLSEELLYEIFNWHSACAKSTRDFIKFEKEQVELEKKVHEDEGQKSQLEKQRIELTERLNNLNQEKDKNFSNRTLLKQNLNSLENELEKINGLKSLIRERDVYLKGKIALEKKLEEKLSLRDDEEQSGNNEITIEELNKKIDDLEICIQQINKAIEEKEGLTPVNKETEINYCRTTWLGVEHPLIFRDFSVSVIV